MPVSTPQRRMTARNSSGGSLPRQKFLARQKFHRANRSESDKARTRLPENKGVARDRNNGTSVA
jgi:hypothetical protein